MKGNSLWMLIGGIVAFWYLFMRKKKNGATNGAVVEAIEPAANGVSAEVTGLYPERPTGLTVIALTTEGTERISVSEGA